MDLAWARADFDITKYSKIKLEDAEIEYRPGGEKRQFRDLGPTGHYYVTPRQKERFEEQMSNTFREELAKSEHFTIVEEAGPDVLLIRGGLYDVVSYVPPDTTGRSEIFISRIGEATLVFELRDSESDAILLRAIDRRAAQQVGGRLSNSNTVTNSSEFRRVAREWATILREGLDRFAVPEEVVGE